MKAPVFVAVCIGLASPAHAQVLPYVADNHQAPCTKADVQGAARTAVAVFRKFPPADGQQAKTGEVVAVRATGWRVGDKALATVLHVAEGLRLSTTEWEAVQILQSDSERNMPERILSTRARIANIGTLLSGQAAAIIELEDPLPGQVVTARVRARPLSPDDPVMAVGYSAGVLRFSTGTLAFPKESSEGKPDEDHDQLLPFELYDGTDRLAIDEGASGGPIFDCTGHVVAVIARNVKQDQMTSGRGAAIASLRAILGQGTDAPFVSSTAWGQHNVLGVPIDSFKFQSHR